VSNQTFTSRRAIEVMEQIGAFLEQQGRASSAEVCAHLGMSQVQTAVYLVQLEKLARIHCIERPMNIQNGRTPTIWGPGATPSDADDVEAPGEKGFSRRVVVRQQWAPNHARMPLDCLLFGVPAALQGAEA
jgi:hypothetical protein